MHCTQPLAGAGRRPSAGRERHNAGVARLIAALPKPIPKAWRREQPYELLCCSIDVFGILKHVRNLNRLARGSRPRHYRMTAWQIRMMGNDLAPLAFHAIGCSEFINLAHATAEYAHICPAQSRSLAISASSTACRSKVDRLTTLSTSEVAASCSSASSRSRVSRASFVFLLAARELRRRVIFSGLGRWKGPASCPLWARSGHLRCNRRCPLYSRKWTCAAHKSMSAKGKKRTSALDDIVGEQQE